MPKELQQATFAAGCFWGVEEAFRCLEGVVSTKVGYAGGFVPNPTYQEVCTGATGHAEAVELEFDPGVVGYEDLLNVFWSIHDPTTLNRQGPDEGEQYRSAIFYHSNSQKEAAMRSKEKLERSGRYQVPIVTQILPYHKFYLAEDYHQHYLLKAGRVSCRI